MKKCTSALLCLVLVLMLAVPGLAADTAHMEAAALVDSATVTVVVTAKQSTANARLTIGFDADYLCYQAFQTDMAVGTAKAEKHQVTIGLASATADAVATGNTIAKVTFAVTGNWDETALTVGLVSCNGTALDEKLTLTVQGSGYRFEDVRAGQWFYEAVDIMASDGIIKGIDATHYGSGLDMNRASFVTLLGRLDGHADTQAQTVFTDVPVNSFYSGHVAWAQENGIVRGVSSTLFAPEDSVSRHQMVLLLYRFAQFKGQDVSVEDLTVLSAFPDSVTLRGETMNAFAWAVDRGIINGMDGKLEPQAPATRAQVAVMLYRFFYEKNG